MDLPVRYDKLDIMTKIAVREEYARIQGGVCAHCNAPLKGNPSAHVTSKKVDKRRFPPTFFKYPVHLHHSHKTGLTIGAVHNYCNAVLWQYHGE